MAIELARAGAAVAIHYHERGDAADSVAASVRELGREARTFAADVRKRTDVESLLREVGAWRGRIDGLVTSAGVYRGPLLEEVDAAEWDEVIHTDLEGSFRTVQAAVPWLRKGEQPAVVTLSSVFGSHPGVGAAPYQMAKAAIEQMTRALALELAPQIRVNSLAPGFIRTDMNRGGHEDPEFRRKIERRTPLGRWGEVDDLAPAVRYLLSPEASWVTGTVLGVDGGIALR